MAAFGFLPIVIIIPAVIVAEFLIGPAFYYSAAGKAYFFCCLIHNRWISFMMLIYNYLSVCKRLYPVSFGSKRVKTGCGFPALSSLRCQSEMTSPADWNKLITALSQTPI